MNYPAQAIRDAMQDLLDSPKGVVPDTAQAFYDAHAGRISTTKVRRAIEGMEAAQ